MSIKVAGKIAWRYIRGSYDTVGISTLSAICFFGIFIGTCCLALQIFMMEGFEKVISEKMQSIYPQLVIEAPYDSEFDTEKITELLDNRFPNTIIATAPAHSMRVIVQSANDNESASAVYLKAIDSEKEILVSSLEQKITTKNNLSTSLENNQVLIGKKLAEFLELSEGDEFDLFFNPNNTLNTQNPSFESSKITIGGIFETGIVQYDKYLIVGSHELMRSLTDQSTITEIGLRLNDNVDDESFRQELEQFLETDVNSWKTLYPALVSASKLEKYVMFFLLILITLIATTNLISVLYTQITNKRVDIALLKTIGMADKYIILIFVFMGLILSGAAAASGLLAAFIIGTALQNYSFIELPDVYYVSQLPIHMTWHTFALIFFIVLFLSLCATLSCIRMIRSIRITQTLRFE
jgi:lipoprotein-releasing system permease protein